MKFGITKYPPVLINWSNEDEVYIAHCPGYYDFKTHGDSPTEAVHQMELAIQAADEPAPRPEELEP